MIELDPSRSRFLHSHSCICPFTNAGVPYCRQSLFLTNSKLNFHSSSATIKRGDLRASIKEITKITERLVSPTEQEAAANEG